LFVANARAEPGACLDDHVESQGSDALDRVGRRRNARFDRIGFARHKYKLYHRLLLRVGIAGQCPLWKPLGSGLLNSAQRSRYAPTAQISTNRMADEKKPAVVKKPKAMAMSTATVDSVPYLAKARKSE